MQRNYRWILFRGVARIFFGGGGHPGHLKVITRLPQGVRGEGPRTVAKFHFLNDSKYQKMNPFFKNINIFLSKSIFSTKTFEKLSIFYKNFSIFSKNYFKFSIFMMPYKSRKIPGEFYYQVEKFIKKTQKQLRWGRTIENDIKIHEIYSKIQDRQKLRNDFNWARKSKQPPAKFCSFGPKMKKKILLNICWISASAPKVYTSGR